jgi:heptosyltransferase-3
VLILPLLRLGALGDMVACTPALKYLAEISGHPCDVIAAGSWSHDLFAHVPFVGQVHVLKSRNAPYWLNRDKRQLVSALRQRGVGPAWVFGNSSHIMPLLKRSDFKDQDIAARQPPVAPLLHVGDAWLDVARQRPHGSDQQWAVPDDTPVNWQPTVSQGEITDVQQWLQQRTISEKKYVIMQIGNKITMRAADPQRASNTKFWPVERWAEVAGHIANIHKMPVLLAGTPQESGLIDEVVAMANNPLVQTAYADLSIRRLAAVLHMAHSCVSVDTGPDHMAAAVNCPVLVLFGETNPARDRPRSTESLVRCLRGEIADTPSDPSIPWADWHGMSGISSASVLAE